MSKKKVNEAFSVTPKEFKKMFGTSQKKFAKDFSKAVGLKKTKKAKKK
jgi:hypothetical protein